MLTKEQINDLRETCKSKLWEKGYYKKQHHCSACRDPQYDRAIAQANFAEEILEIIGSGDDNAAS
jgi:hypothetical protein